MPTGVWLSTAVMISSVSCGHRFVECILESFMVSQVKISSIVAVGNI